jgi:hypothetical protein
VSDEKGPWYGRVAEIAATWLTAQNFNNVLLMSILIGMFVGGKYALDHVIPAHLTQIQRGYEKEGEANRELIQRLDKAHMDERSRTLDMYDRWFGIKSGFGKTDK